MKYRTRPKYRARWMIGLAGAIGALAGHAQGMRRPAAASGVLTTPVIQVVALSAGASVAATGPGLSALSFGHVSWMQSAPPFGIHHKQDKDSFALTSDIGLRLDCSLADTGRKGSVSAFLQHSDSRFSIMLDGVKLSISAALISSAVVCGSTTRHSLEVEVPVTAAAGPVSPSVQFKVMLR